MDRDALVQGLTVRGHRCVLTLDKPEDLPALIEPHIRAGDMVVCLGAGTITAWANALPEQLAPLLADRAAMGGMP
jgi:UDP-N-acetylmuramate--alanine ligase